MSINTSSDGRLVHFPGKTVLSRQEAMHYLGVSRMAFLALRTLRCIPRPPPLDGRAAVRVEQLEPVFYTPLPAPTTPPHIASRPVLEKKYSIRNYTM